MIARFRPVQHHSRIHNPSVEGGYQISHRVPILNVSMFDETTSSQMLRRGDFATNASRLQSRMGGSVPMRIRDQSSFHSEACPILSTRAFHSARLR